MSRIETPSFVWFVLILGGLAILAVTAFASDSLIFHWAPFIGTFLLYLNSNYKWLLQLTFAAAVVAHLSESYYAYHLAVLLKLPTIDVFKWTVQTALLGFPSLRIIMKKYKEENKYK